MADIAFGTVWQPGTGAQWLRWGMSGQEFKTQDTTYFAQGPRISSLAIRDGKIAAVWRPGSGAQWVRWGLSDDEFKVRDTAYLGQGNNNASGSHNGAQAWAFDFGLPAGTEIRAARAGTVEWLQENLTATYDPSLPSTLPPNDLQNWGNAVRLRHAGGFTSWYFHIQTNGVLVNVGDVVTQGQAIAISGNTGRSSGAHLHFQVQADSTDWGQSVAHTFGENCEQPAGGASVTSDNVT